MKRFCKTLWEKVINFLKTSNLKKRFCYKQLKYFTYGKLRKTLSFTRDSQEVYIMLLGDLSFQTVEKTHTEKTSELSPQTHYEKRKRGKPYIKDSGDFINKIKNIPEGEISITADVVGLFCSIRHEAGLNALPEALDDRENNHISTENLLKMAEFVLKTITSNLMVKLKNSC